MDNVPVPVNETPKQINQGYNGNLNSFTYLIGDEYKEKLQKEYETIGQLCQSAK